MSRLFAAAVAAMTLLALTAGAALAAPPSAATIDVTANLGQPGTFVATSDLLCPSGTTSDEATGDTHGNVTTYYDLKTFTCGDGSGTFTLSIVAHVVDCAAMDWGTWSVYAGTDDYAGLSGHGLLVGTYFGGDANHCNAVGIVDHLTGMLRL